jgi:AAA domain-containing protein
MSKSNGSENVADASVGQPSNGSAKYRLHIVTPELIVPAREWLIDGLFPERGIVFVGGHPKAGKTWLSLALAISIATGNDFLGRRVRTTGSVLYLLGEDDLGDTLERIDSLLAGHRLDRRALERRITLSDASISLESRVDQEWLLQYAKEEKPALVVFDPLARFLSNAEENSATEMRPITNWLRKLQRETSAALSIVHHTDKAARGLRGTSDLRALSEATLILGKKGDRSPVELEVRRGRCPDPFDIELVDSPNGGVRWDVSTHDEKVSRLEEVKEFLREAGPEGISITSVQGRLEVRWETAKTLLEAAHAVKLGKGRWYLPDSLSPILKPIESLGRAGDATTLHPTTSTEGSGGISGNAVEPQHLDSSHPAEESEEGHSPSFPPTRGLETPRGDSSGTSSTSGVQ